MPAPGALTSSPLFANVMSGALVFVATAGLLGTWVNQRIAPIEDRLAAIDRRLDKIDLTMAPLLTLYAQHASDVNVLATMQKDIDRKLDKELFESTKTTVGKQIDDDKTSTLRTLEEISHQVHELENKIVTRDEHTKESADITSRFDGLDRRIAELAARINGLSERSKP